MIPPHIVSNSMDAFCESIERFLNLGVKGLVINPPDSPEISSEQDIRRINAVLGSSASPPLTSIAFPLDRIVKTAVDLLTERIVEKSEIGSVVKNFTPQFIIRGS